MDVYKVGISIAMQNGVSAVLGTIMADVLKLNHTVMGAVSGFGRLKLAIAGVGAVTLGVGLLKGVADLSKHGEKYTHELELMKIAGMGVKEVQDSIAAANKVSSDVMTTTPTENLKTIRELRLALASADVRPGQKADPAAATREAVEHLATVQRISGIMSSVLAKDGKPFDGSGQAFELTKGAEILGLTQDPKKFDAVLEGWTQAIIASGGKLQGSDFFANVKYMRGAGAGMSMDFLTKTLPTFMQELKTGGTSKSGGGSGQGGGAGNPLASLFAEIVGQQISNKSLAALEKIGMVDPKKVHHLKGGKVNLDPGAIVGAGLESENPFEFVRDVFEPHLRKNTNYLDKDKEGNLLHPAEFRSFVATAFPNRVAQQIVNMMLTQQPRVAGDRALIEASMTSRPAFQELIRNDPVLARKAAESQLDRALTDIGKNQVVTEIIYRFARALSFLSETIEAHPTATKWILAATAGLAGLLVVVGSLALGVAAFSAVGGIGLGIVALGTALLGLAGIFGYLTTRFPALEAMRVRIVSFFSQVFTPEMGAKLTGGLQSVQATFLGSMSQVGNNIGSALLGLAVSIGSSATAALEPMQQVILAAVATKIEAMQQAVLAAVTNAIEALQASILAGSASVLTSIGTWISTIPGTLEAALQSVKDSVSAFVVDLAASIKTDIFNIWLALGEGLNSLIQNIGAWFANLPGMIWGSLTGQANAAVATGAASNVAQDAGQGWPGLKPADILSAVNDNKPGKGDPLVNEITQYQRDKAAGRLDANGQPTGPVVARVPPSGLSGQSTRGSNSDPIHVVVDNQINEASISRGVSSNLAGKMNRPASGYTGTDGRMDLLGIYAGVGQP